MPPPPLLADRLLPAGILHRRSNRGRVLGPVLALALAVPALPAAPQPPALLMGRGDQLERVRREVLAGDTPAARALGEIRRKADAALAEPVTNVVAGGDLPPSGDPHDYYSLSPYWWPDPAKPDGLPYIWRDGQENPERRESDITRIAQMSEAVTALVPAWYFSGESRYAESAIERLRAWFLDPATRMNPNMRYAQSRRGHGYNSHAGIIETTRFRWLVDCAILLESHPGWTAEDARGLRRWFREFAEWLAESPEGLEEAMAPNNHGSWHSVQVVLFSLYGGDPARARAFLERTPARIFAQVFIDGRQPQELVRTRSLHYSDYNNRALVDLARLGRQVEVDLFRYRSTEGRSIRLSLDYLVPFVLEEKPWPAQQIRPLSPSGIAETYWRAAIGFNDQDYAGVVRRLDSLPAPIVQLLDPLPEDW